jgi:hypothetical protein
MRRTYYVYIMASHTKTLYIGVTNNLLQSGKVEILRPRAQDDPLNSAGQRL